MLKIYAMTVLLALCGVNAMAQDLVLERAIFKDPSAEMSLGQVKSATFTDAPELIFEGYSGSALWLRLTLDVPANVGPLVVRLQPNLLDEASLYVPAAEPSGTDAVLQMNARSAQKESRLSLQPGRHTLYLRVASAGALRLKAQVLTLNEAARQDFAEQRALGAVVMVYAMLFGVLGVLLLSRHQGRQLLLFFSFQLAMSLAFYLLYFDFIADWVPVADSKTAVRFVGLANFLGFTLLMQAVLGLCEKPQLQRWARWAALLALLLLVFYALGDRRLALMLSAALGPLVSLALLAVVLYLLLQFIAQPVIAWPIRWLIGGIVGANVVLLCLTMLQLLGFHTSGDLLLWAQPLRAIFQALALAIFWWQRTFTTSQLLQQTQMAQALAKQEVDAKTQRLATQSQFMAMLMHELKTPLYVIQLAVGALQQRSSDNANDAQRLRNMAHAADDMNFILDRCVQADQLDQSTAPVDKVLVSVKTLLLEVMQISGHERIRLQGMPANLGAGKVRTDFQYTRIILTNLLSNALKYSPPESLVQLTIQPSGSGTAPSLHFRVSNTIGSAGRPDPSQVFSRYYRSENAKKVAGAGLGLWLAQAIAVKLGTSLHCSSDDEMVHFEFSLERT